jgi:diguanylate cyclase (GGDEF)-like protein
MEKKRAFYFSQRLKYIFITSVTLLPVASLLLLTAVFIFAPIFRNLESIVDKGYHKIRPLQHLQVALVSAVMPPNDYLIHGNEEEKDNWILLQKTVDSSFSLVLRASHSVDSRRLILEMKEEWNHSVVLGNQLFQIGPNFDVNHYSVEVMERFDSDVENIVRQLMQLTVQLEEEANAEYLSINILKKRAINLIIAAVLLGFLLGVMGSIWLTKSRSQILALSLHDQLTGIYNRRALEDALSKLQKYQVSWQSQYFSLLLMDIDNFKTVNDTYGHDAGDLALKSLTAQTGKIIRDHDIFGRYGGEEFLIILPETNIKNAVVLAERIRIAIESTPILLPDKRGELRITVSIGCASSGNHTVSIKDLLRSVDKAMYEAKNRGRNRVISTPEL